MTRLPLFHPNGREIIGEALVDQGAYAVLTDYRWHLNSHGYAYRYRADGRTLLMHREIMDAQRGEIVDHINRDRTDNRRSNLRIVTASQNGLNTTKRNGCTSRFVGVSQRGTRWRAYVCVNGQQRSLGSYATEQEAAAVSTRARERLIAREDVERIDSD